MKKKGKAWFAVGTLLLVGALGLTLFNVTDALRAKRSAEALLRAIEISMDNQAPVFPVYTDSESGAEAEMPAMEVDGSRYIGVIEIPSLSISLPVFAQWNYDLLKKAPCHYSGSCYTNDLVICAHNYRTHFGRILSASIGADVYFIAANGESFHYLVTNRETLNADESDRMRTTDGTWDLTLFTCTLSGRTRCTLRCSLENDP